MRFNSGDPVWCLIDRQSRPAKIAATVVKQGKVPTFYVIDVEGAKSSHPTGFWVLEGKYLIPRKDDYDGDEKQTNFKAIQDLTGGWNPQTGSSSRPKRVKEKEKI